MNFRQLPSLWFLALLAGSLCAQGSTFTRPFIHESLLDRSPIVVRATLMRDELLPPSNVQLTTFEVLSVLRGPPRDEIIVAGMGARGRAFADLDKLLFLEPLSSGFLYRLVDLIDLTPEDGTIRENTIRAYLALDVDGNPVALRDRLKDLAYRGIESPSGWAMGLAVRELERLVKAAPHLFGANDLARLQRRQRSVPRNERARFSQILRVVAARVASNFAGAEEAFEAGPQRELFLKAVERFRRLDVPEERVRLLDALVETFGARLDVFCRMLLGDEDPRVVARAAWYLGEFANLESATYLVHLLEESEPGKGLIPIEALGKLGNLDAVPALRARLAHDAEADAVLTALARIGGAESADLLARLEVRLAEEEDEEERLARVRTLRSLEFAKEEARRRREARKRYLSK